MKFFFYCLMACIVLSSCNSKKGLSVAIQPYNGVDARDVSQIKKAIEVNYNARVYIKPIKEIPQETFINVKSPRYRADKIIALLKEEKSDTIDYLLGISSEDISTTKKNKFGGVKKPKSKYEDWGIFGLGYRPGPSCIVSTYRLGKKSKKRSNRLVKITLHEIGHNMGLPHCDRDPNCVMRDAAESIKTVDQVSKDLCEFCRKDIE